MGTAERSNQIVLLVEERGFVTVKELSTLHNVSEVTIRRDLNRLDGENRLRRTHGGAVPVRATTSLLETQPQQRSATSLEGFSIFDKVDVLVATSCDPNSDKLLLDRMEQHGTPVIAESIKLPGMKTLVSVDNYKASRALGRWAGDYARDHFDGRAVVLDLTYRLENTRVRSRGFMDGLNEILPEADRALSINAQSTQSTTYQLVKDALEVYSEISIIFAINDATAIGAIQACHDLGIDRDSLAVLTFGMEGDTLKQALFTGEYCKAGVAMFPEIVGPVCVEAAIDAFNQKPMPMHLVTPFTILTPETLSEYYLSSESGWSIRWDTVMQSLSIPLPIEPPTSRSAAELPKRIGFVVPFIEHEWYLNLIAAMQAHVQDTGIVMEIVDFNQHLKEEVELKKRGIAERAAAQVQAGDVLLISSGQTTLYLAEELLGKESITVITNSMSVFDILRDSPGITLISTGGVLRSSNNTLVGLIGEGSLKELRADKLFLGVAGVTLDFGLSDDPMTDVAMKQAMVKAAREVILLADHTKFGREAVVQVASANVVNKLITDRALPASARLDFAALGTEVIVAKV
ncbi:MAG: DeoR family transcriptional regulator [Chloroflexota bacterium]|jgi:DeoR/GlpR family transcriptional regulator of sugar metabolism